MWYQRVRSSLRCGPGVNCIGRPVQHQSLECYLTMNRWSKDRLIKALGMQAFLGLAICVFAWGLEYKLSLYEPPQTAAHQIPKAKLLSNDERSDTAQCPLIIRTRTATRVLYTAPTLAILILLLATSALNPPISKRVKQSPGLLKLHRAILSSLFVRPPPALA
jgi:hypothetical protein